MRYASIKFFPSDKVDYISHYFLNFFFSLIFILNISYLNILLFGENNPSYTLLIPVTDDLLKKIKI